MSKILIMMSTYNGEKCLEKQLDSIYGQTIIDEIDILVRDDGSTDQTCNMLKAYQERYCNFSYIKGNNIGLNSSFFELINCAGEYEYYAFSDQDDIWFPDKVEVAFNCLEKMNKETPLLYGSCSLLVDSKLQKIGMTQKMCRDINVQNILFQNFIPGHTQMFNHKLLKILKKNISLSNIHVYDYWVSLCACLLGKIIFDNTYHTYYIQHKSNSYGYGSGVTGWIKTRVSRLLNGDCQAFTTQNKMFYNQFKNSLALEDKRVIEALFNSTTLYKRFRFIVKFKPYRQRKLETFILYYLILVNAYRI